MTAYAFNPGTWGTGAGKSLSSKPVWDTEWVPGPPDVDREPLPWKQRNKAGFVARWPSYLLRMRKALGGITRTVKMKNENQYFSILLKGISNSSSNIWSCPLKFNDSNILLPENLILASRFQTWSYRGEKGVLEEAQQFSQAVNLTLHYLLGAQTASKALGKC